MNADDKKKVRQRVLTDIFLRYGSGNHHLQRFAAAKCWNWLAWVLIILGVIGWIFFLRWDPAGP